MTDKSKSSIIVALENALVNDPSDSAMRIHLAELLQASGHIDQALEHARIVLHTSPDNIKGLQIASTTAEELGDPAAASYKNLLRALSTNSDTTEIAEEKISNPGAQVPDTPDALLEMWDSAEAPPEPEIGELSASTIKLQDVAGMDTVKQQLQASFLNPMRNPEMLYRFGQPLRGGMVLGGRLAAGKHFWRKPAQAS